MVMVMNDMTQEEHAVTISMEVILQRKQQVPQEHWYPCKKPHVITLLKKTASI
jgi:hypothetical protein